MSWTRTSCAPPAFSGRITSDNVCYTKLLRYAIGLCDGADGDPIATANFPREIRCSELPKYTGDALPVLQASRGLVHVAVRPLKPEDAGGPQLVLVHDMSFVERRSEETRRYLFWFFVALGGAVALITVVIAQLSWRGWVHGLRALLRGESILRPGAVPTDRPAGTDRIPVYLS